MECAKDHEVVEVRTLVFGQGGYSSSACQSVALVGSRALPMLGLVVPQALGIVVPQVWGLAAPALEIVSPRARRSAALEWAQKRVPPVS
jgi:hypothetical protein